MDLPKIDSTNLWDKTYMILKERIVNRTFHPNQKLSIPELAAQLGVSRTPIRDALTRLEMDGLVKTVSKVGTFVTPIVIEDILDIIDTRLMIEYWVVERLPILSTDELNAKINLMEEILQKSSQSISQIALGSYLRTDYNLLFHLEFVKLGGNKRNVDIYTNMMNYHLLAAENDLFTKEMVTSAIEQHWALIEALKERHWIKLKIAIKVHLEDAKARLIKQLEINNGKL